LPSGEYLWTRAFWCPSETQMSPRGESAVCVQRLKGSPLNLGAGLPGVPMVSTTLPCSEHLRTAAPKSSVR
jgi:hypothetical protein